ncbi:MULTISPECIES: ATP-binding protein [unclassified Streptomyces]|uniref:ATP-binding protein n=1 Tax=unclassified Streptomyces TaxID=2593676 RepID=UPI00365377C4
MRVMEKVAALLGVGGERSAPPPRYEGITDGLVLTDAEAWGWWTCETSNSDLMPEPERDDEQTRAETALASTLAGLDVHVRVLWSPYSADTYRDDAPEMYRAGAWEDWAEDRAARLDQLALPVRHVLIGVRLGARHTSAVRKVTEAAGVPARGVPARELATWHTAARRLGRRLEASPWKCQAAPVELLAWMVTREQHRGVPAPVAGRQLVSGAVLAALTQGRALPYPDHVQLVDAEGTTAAWVSILVMPAFPEKMITPGAGEWLRCLAEVLYLPSESDDEDDEDVVGRLTAVSPEASIRFRVLPKRQAIARTDETAKSVREQTRSAAESAIGDPGRVITDAGEAMADLRATLEREEVSLVEDHPRVIVTSTESLEDLRARVDAVVAHYADMGITVQVGVDEQRPLWLETWPGDRLRVPDLGHMRDTRALAGAWWWGGARVGDDHGPVIGYLTGTTPGVCRLTPAGAGGRDATTTAYVGRSGRGKTTALMLSALDAAHAGAWVLALDFKGDVTGLVTAAERYGLPAHLVRMTRQMAGSADLIPLLSEAGRDAARAEVPAQLSLVTPAHLRAAGAETAIQAAVNAVMDAPDPATWRVIESLRASDDHLARQTGDALWELAQTPQGGLFMGRPAGGAPPLGVTPGIRVVQMPGLSLPAVGEERERWTSVQALSVAVMHSVLAWGIVTSGRSDLRTLPKLVVVPEVHVLTGTPTGRHFLDYVSRVGRALGTHLHLDTQDATGLAAMPGVVEQLAVVVGFQLTTTPQQDALAELLGLPATQHTRDLIRSIGIQPDGEIRHGHSIIRDRRFGAATVQWDVPTAELLTLLDTSPRAEAADIDAEVHA